MQPLHKGAKLITILVFILSSAVAFGQSQSGTAPTQDPQAVAILTQTLNAVGGLSAISAIQDYTGTGNITYFWASEPVQAAVTVQGMGLGDYRLDASLEQGIQTWACADGLAGILITPSGASQSAPFYNLATEGSRTLPYIRIAAELADNSTSINYIGLVSTSGGQAYQVHFAQATPAAMPTGVSVQRYGEFDLYIDPKSFLIVKLTESLRSDTNLNTTYPHEIDFSNYQPVGSILAPFTISERINKQQTWSITLSTLSFNSGLTEEVFTPQPN